MTHSPYWELGTNPNTTFHADLVNARVEFDDHLPMYEFVTQNGSRYHYRHAYQDRVRIQVTHVASVDWGRVETYWRNRTVVGLWRREGTGVNSITYVGTQFRIVNATHPIGKLTSPYLTPLAYRSGQIILQGGK